MFDDWGRVTPEYELIITKESIETCKRNIRFYTGLLDDEDELIKLMGKRGLEFSEESLEKLLEKKEKLERELEVI